MSDDKVEMNEELQKWIQESKQKVVDYKEKKGKLKNKPSGNCMLCGEKKAEHTCLKCENYVCKSCYFKIIGICKKCVPPEIAGKWDGSHPDWEKELGVEWVD